MEKLIKLNELVTKADPRLNIIFTNVSTDKNPFETKNKIIITRKDWKVEELMQHPLFTSIDIEIDDDEIIMYNKNSSIKIVRYLDEEEEFIKTIDIMMRSVESISDEDLVYLLNSMPGSKRRVFKVKDSKISISTKMGLELAVISRASVNALIKRNRVNDLLFIGSINKKFDIGNLLRIKLFDIGLLEKGKKNIKTFSIPIGINAKIKLLLMPTYNNTSIVSVVIGKNLKRLSNIYLYSQKDIDVFVDTLKEILSLPGTERVIETVNKLTPATAMVKDNHLVVTLYDDVITHSLYSPKDVFKDIATFVNRYRYTLIRKSGGFGVQVFPSPKAKTIELMEIEHKERQDIINFK